MGGTPCRRDSCICHPTANCPSGTSSPPGNPCLIPLIWIAVLVGILPSSADGHYTGGQEPVEKHKTCWLWLGWQSNSQKAAAHLEHLMRGLVETNENFSSLFVKMGALSSILTLYRLDRSWEIWGQMLCISKFLEMVLEAQVCFPLTPIQTGSPAGFEGTIPHPSQQAARRLLHAWQRDQEGFSPQAL